MPFHTRLFVGNLPVTTNDTDLHAAFSKYGDIQNVELKSKSESGTEVQKFAFITLSSSNSDIESCIQYYSMEDFQGNKIYVTRARESFLERLQRERQEAQIKANAKEKDKKPINHHPVMKINEKLNLKHSSHINNNNMNQESDSWSEGNKNNVKMNGVSGVVANNKEILIVNDKKKNDSTQKRLESLQKKRQEFKQKQNIIKSGLVGIDKAPNKKTVFKDNDFDSPTRNCLENQCSPDSKQIKDSLFDDSDDNDELNFEIKKQYEGKSGQKILELQSRFKSDKRFKLDERFVENDHTEGLEIGEPNDEDNEVAVVQSGEKAKQLNILQDVLGIAIKSRSSDLDTTNTKRKSKSNLGMLRFDPMQPEHAKFLAPVEEKVSASKLKKKNKEREDKPQEISQQDVEKVEVSKDQFYKVSETLKEAIAQPNTFSLRSLFNNTADEDNIGKAPQELDTNYIPLKKVKVQKINPLDTAERNPFKYDSSDSEDEENPANMQIIPEITEVKAVWKENLFFSGLDSRFADGLSFFNQPTSKVQKDRRELKSVMKKRLHNKERKDQSQMFKKKIGGKRKPVKKNFRRKT